MSNPDMIIIALWALVTLALFLLLDKRLSKEHEAKQEKLEYVKYKEEAHINQ